MSLRAVLKTGKSAVFKHTSISTAGLQYYWTCLILLKIYFKHKHLRTTSENSPSAEAAQRV